MAEDKLIRKIVVVGGGTAGWITAGLIAARHSTAQHEAVSVTLVESPDIPIIGVGEGTWPTMVDTLRKLGISEVEFVQKCDASFKQASKFARWCSGADDDVYYHPFSRPQGFDQISLVNEWQQNAAEMPFAEAVSLQPELCEQKLAPKPADSVEYATVENHGYHLDAGKFTKLLQDHCTRKLGVRHVLADVTDVNAAGDGDIASLDTKQAGVIEGDLFVDCTGTAGLLIDKHFKVPFVSKKDVLFIDRALAVQVPYHKADDPIESATVSTAQTAGWIWDIGLPTRRGVGHVYASKYITREQAEAQLRDYLRGDVEDVDALQFREIRIKPGHREKFWVRNCVAVGMSSGFLEPLEASALVMIELAANTISLHMPASRAGMDVVAKNYNENFLFRWGRIIDFLKLHYVLSSRSDSQFWIDNRKPETVPESLSDLLTLWKHQSPCNNGFQSPYDMFPAASYQYILYGMGFRTESCHLENAPSRSVIARQHMKQVQDRRSRIPGLLPTTRELVEAMRAIDIEGELDHERTMSDSCMTVPLAMVNSYKDKYPLFFRKQPGTGQLECVAMVGLSRGEQLVAPPDLAVAGEGDAAMIGRLQALGLFEPVKLDIVFDDRSALVLKGLQVVNRGKLAALPADVSRQLGQQGLTGVISAMQQSLNQVSALIALRNQRLAA